MDKRTQYFLQFDILHIILTCLVIEIQSFKYRTIMEFSVFSLYFEEQLHNAYSCVLAYIKSILPYVISFHLSYSLLLCIKNSQRYMFSNAPICYLYVLYTELFSIVCLKPCIFKSFKHRETSYSLNESLLPKV